MCTVYRVIITRVRCCFTSTETIRTIGVREPGTVTSVFTQLYSQQVQCWFTSTETIRTIRDGEPRTTTSTFTQLLSSVFSASWCTCLHRLLATWGDLGELRHIMSHMQADRSFCDRHVHTTLRPVCNRRGMAHTQTSLPFHKSSLIGETLELKSTYWVNQRGISNQTLSVSEINIWLFCDFDLFLPAGDRRHTEWPVWEGRVGTLSLWLIYFNNWSVLISQFTS